MPVRINLALAPVHAKGRDVKAYYGALLMRLGYILDMEAERRFRELRLTSCRVKL